MEQSLEQGATRAVESIQIEIADIVQPIGEQIKRMRRFSIWIFLAAVIVFLAAILNVIVTVMK